MTEFVSVLDIMENAPYGAQTAVRDEVASMDAELRRRLGAFREQEKISLDTFRSAHGN